MKVCMEVKEQPPPQQSVASHLWPISSCDSHQQRHVSASDSEVLPPPLQQHSLSSGTLKGPISIHIEYLCGPKVNLPRLVISGSIARPSVVWSKYSLLSPRQRVSHGVDLMMADDLQELSLKTHTHTHKFISFWKLEEEIFFTNK